MKDRYVFCRDATVLRLYCNAFLVIDYAMITHAYAGIVMRAVPTVRLYGASS